MPFEIVIDLALSCNMYFDKNPHKKERKNKKQTKTKTNRYKGSKKNLPCISSLLAGRDGVCLRNSPRTSSSPSLWRPGGSSHKLLKNVNAHPLGHYINIIFDDTLK